MSGNMRLLILGGGEKPPRLASGLRSCLVPYTAAVSWRHSIVSHYHRLLLAFQCQDRPAHGAEARPETPIFHAKAFPGGGEGASGALSREIWKIEEQAELLHAIWGEAVVRALRTETAVWIPKYFRCTRVFSCIAFALFSRSQSVPLLKSLS